MDSSAWLAGRSPRRAHLRYIGKRPKPSSWAPSTLSAKAVKAGLGVATWAASSPIDPAVNSFGNVIACYEEQFYAALYSTPKTFHT